MITTTTTLPPPIIALADWRRRVAEVYTATRNAPAAEQPAAWHAFQMARDNLFKSHPQSPLNDTERAAFTALDYYPYDPDWRVIGKLNTDVVPETLSMWLLSDGEFRYTRVACIDFTVKGIRASLSLFWVEGYGGGIFLPFKDTTNSQTTFGGGRYLYDTIKGADLGVHTTSIVLDFNYAYNPSCAYNSDWVCPLSPPENRLPFGVTAGEKIFV